MLRNVIFDYGLVLCRPPTYQAIDRMSGVFGADHPTFWALYEKNRGLYDQGELTPGEYWSRFAQDAGTRIDDRQIESLRTWDIEMWSSLDESLIQWGDALRSAGYKTSILSNLNREFTAHVRKTFRWLERFDCLVFSSEVGLVKPDLEIYRHCLRALQGEAEETLFIDDREANVHAAHQLGITALQYCSKAQLSRELQARGFDILPVIF